MMKYYTIKENHLFSKAYKKGKRSVSDHITVYVLPDYHAARLQRAHPLKLRINRIGLTVTKKLGGAVIRNRVKRIMREAYYRICREFCVKTGNLIVIAARERAIPVKTDVIYEDMLQAFSKLGLLEGKR